MPAQFGDHSENSHSGDIEDVFPLDDYEDPFPFELKRRKSSREGLEREQIRVWLLADQKKQLKIAAVEKGTTIQSLVAGLIGEYLRGR